MPVGGSHDWLAPAPSWQIVPFWSAARSFYKLVSALRHVDTPTADAHAPTLSAGTPTRGTCLALSPCFCCPCWQAAQQVMPARAAGVSRSTAAAWRCCPTATAVPPLSFPPLFPADAAPSALDAARTPGTVWPKPQAMTTDCSSAQTLSLRGAEVQVEVQAGQREPAARYVEAAWRLAREKDWSYCTAAAGGPVADQGERPACFPACSPACLQLNPQCGPAICPEAAAARASIVTPLPLPLQARSCP